MGSFFTSNFGYFYLEFGEGSAISFSVDCYSILIRHLKTHRFTLFRLLYRNTNLDFREEKNVLKLVWGFISKLVLKVQQHTNYCICTAVYLVPGRFEFQKSSVVCFSILYFGFSILNLVWERLSRSVLSDFRF